MQSTKKIIGIVAIVVFLVGAGFIIFKYGSKSNDDASSGPEVGAAGANTQATLVTNGDAPAAPTSPQTASPYKNGTYSATGSYQSPAGTESILVSVTLDNGIIENSTVTSEANDGTSRRYQNMFISGYKTYVTGKNIASLSVGKVSGSSLTGIGFNQALATIKAQASA